MQGCRPCPENGEAVDVDNYWATLATVTHLELDTPDGTADSYLTGSGPGVLFYIDAIGLRPQTEGMADRIAGWGYTVLAPNVLYARVYLEVLREHATGTEVGVVGYCMGARLAVRTACLDRGVVACAGFHGGGLATEEPDSPHLGLPNARAEFVFGHADNDRGMQPDAIERLGQTLAAAGLTATNEVYPEAPHGYTMKDTSTYQEAGAERSFRELRTLLERALA
jgi:carboxymethylenebutenolidase